MSDHHRDLGITLLDAKYLDPACHKGCQSLVHQHEIAQLKEWNQKRAGQFACTEQRLASQIAKLEVERDLILAKYRAAWNGLEAIVRLTCDARKEAASAIKRCVDLGSSTQNET